MSIYFKQQQYVIPLYISHMSPSGTCWSSYHKGLLASSDYEGTVTLWDAFTGVKNRSFQVSSFYAKLT